MEFLFDATGDTNALTEAGSAFGGFGAVFRLSQKGPSADGGVLTLFYRCDVAHSGFDNVAFWDRDRVVFVEDAGDTLHTQQHGDNVTWEILRSGPSPLYPAGDDSD